VRPAAAPPRFDDEAEVVVIAALAAREAGASVIVVEAEAHIGAHAICSGGNLSFGADAANDITALSKMAWMRISTSGSRTKVCASMRAARCSTPTAL